MPAHDWDTALSDFLTGLHGSREEKTERFYRVQLRQLRTWCVENEIALADFRMPTMRRYMAHRADTVSESTRRSDAIAARVFLRWCKREGYTEVDPLREYQIPKAPKAFVHVPTPDDICRLLTAVRERHDPRHNPGARFQNVRDRRFWRDRDYALICVLVETGLRIGEVLDLELADYRPDECRLTVRESKTDTPRIVPITDALIQPVNAWLKVRPKTDCMALFLNQFGEPVKERAFCKAFDAYLQFAGLEHFTRHSIRHMTLTALVGKNPRTAQLIAGHRNISTTMGYDHTAQEKLAADHAEVNPLGSILQNKRAAAKKRVKIT